MSNLKIFCSAPSHLPKAPAAANAKYWVPGSLEGVDLQGIWGVAPSGACRNLGPHTKTAGASVGIFLCVRS